MDLNTLYRGTVEAWTDRVNAVRPDQWDAPTPDEEWDVAEPPPQPLVADQPRSTGSSSPIENSVVKGSPRC